MVNPLNTATGLSDVLEQPIVMQGSEYNLLWISEVAGAIPKTVGASLSKINDQQQDQNAIVDEIYSKVLKQIQPEVAAITGIEVNMQYTFQSSSYKNSAQDNFDEAINSISDLISQEELDFYNNLNTSLADTTFTQINQVINDQLSIIRENRSSMNYQEIERVVVLSTIIQTLSTEAEKASCAKRVLKAAAGGALIGGLRGAGAACIVSACVGAGAGFVSGALTGAAWGVVSGFVACQIFD